jgi:4'-phosphopantetheinyl transferase
VADLIVGWTNDARPESGSLLIGRLVARMCDIDAGDVVVSRLCGRCGSSAHGRPYVSSPLESSPHVSLSRAGGMVIAAACDAGPVGIDIERVDAAGVPAPGEQNDPTVLWVFKEALLKATGLGLSIDPDAVHIDIARKVVEWPTQIDDPGPLWLSAVPAPTGWTAAVAALCESAPSLTVAGEVLEG